LIKNRIIAIFIIISIIFSNISYATNAIQKRNESIYINTDFYGNVEKINGYISYKLSNISNLVEYGNFESFQILSKYATPVISGDTIMWDVSGDKEFDYIGKISIDKSKLIPWTFDIKYYLNGVETVASELSGASGLIKIMIHVVPNKETYDYYKNNYMMEITSSYDMTRYTSVESEEATISQVGKTKTLNFIVLPGQDKEISIEIGSNKFSMDGITIGMVPLQGDILDRIQDIVNDKNKLRDAIDNTNNDLNVIFDQLASTGNNIDKIVSGTSSLKDGINKIDENNQKRKDFITSYQNDLNNLSGDFSLLSDEVNDILKDTEYLKNRVNEIKEVSKNLNKNLKDFNSNLEKNKKDLDRIEKRSNDLDEDLDELHNLIVSLRGVVSSSYSLLGNLDDVSDLDLNKVTKGLYSIKESTEEIANETATKMATGGTDVELYSDILENASEIGNSLKTVSAELEKASSLIDDTNTSVGGIREKLVKLSNSLGDSAEVIEGLSKKSKDVPDSIKNLSTTVSSLTTLIKTATDSIDKDIDKDSKRIIEFVENVEDVLNILKGVEEDLKNTNITLQDNLELAKQDLDILSNDFNTGANEAIEGTEELLLSLKNISKRSTSLKNSNNTIHDVIKEDIDDLENKTNLFNINKDDNVVSFVSDKNEDIEKVQFFVQTKAIKENNSESTEVIDLEPQKEKMSLLDKIKNIFEKIIEFFKNLFKIS